MHVPLPDVVEAWRAEFGEDEVSPNYLGRLTRTIGVREERRKMIAGAKTRVYAVRRNDLR